MCEGGLGLCFVGHCDPPLCTVRPRVPTPPSRVPCVLMLPSASGGGPACSHLKEPLSAPQWLAFVRIAKCIGLTGGYLEVG